MSNSMWNYWIIIYVYYYHTYVVQIAINATNNVQEPGRNLAAVACTGEYSSHPI